MEYTLTEIAYEDAAGIHPIANLTNPGYEVWERGATGYAQKQSTDVKLGKKGDVRIRVTNQLPSYNVSVLKQDSTTNAALEGAHFNLYGNDYSPNGTTTANPIKENLISDGEGRISLESLNAGTYYLVETQAPAGYMMTSEPIEVTVNPASTASKTIGGVTYPLYVTTGGTNENVSVEQSGNTYSYTITVPNTPGVQLPSTGGMGTALYTAAGLSLILGASLWLVLRRRKEQQN